MGAFLRGVEATLTGRLIAQTNGALLLHIPGINESVRLAPLRRKVQWDTAANREQAATSEERASYDRLRAQSSTPFSPVRITGPLIQGAGSLILEVRHYSLAPAQAGSAPFQSPTVQGGVPRR